MALGQIVAPMMINKCVKFKDNSFNSMEIMGKIQYNFKSVKGHNFANMSNIVMALGQLVALVMFNKCVKFEDCSFHSMDVMTLQG